MTMYVSNLSNSVTADSLRKVFETIGQVLSCKVIIDSITKKSRGFGFVEMKDLEKTQEAVRMLNGKEVDGRHISVTLANSKSDRHTF